MGTELMVYREQPVESGFVTAEVYLSPLPDTEPIRVQARIGSLVRDILPAEARAPMICVIDGIPMKREWWMQRPVCEGDRIQFYPIYLGGKGSRSILGIIAMIAVAVVANWAATAFVQAGGATWGAGLIKAGIMLLGSALVSAILPPVEGAQNGEGDKASSVYSVDTAGNQARIFSPIPVQYGRVKYYPNYACQPYTFYHMSDPQYAPTDNFNPIAGEPPVTEFSQDQWDAGIQYYYAIFCLGQGEYEIEDIQIADASVSSYSDVLVRRVLPPGVKPYYVWGNVVTSDAVSGQSMDEGNWIGYFPVCGPTRKVGLIELDFIFPQGLCKLDDNGKAGTYEVAIQVQIARINNLGLPVEPFQNMLNEGQNFYRYHTLTPVRHTLRLRVEPARYAVRVCRYGAKDKENTRIMDSLQWGAMRGFIDEEAPLCSTATHFELVLRASEQLSSLSQRKIAIIATRKLSSWDDPTLTPTSSPARALWDKWTNSVYGDGMPLDRIDVDKLRHYDAIAAERGDEFNYVFENRVSSQEADQTIAKVMRCVALQRQGVKTIIRDELVDMPLTLFNPTNTAEKSVSLEYIQVTEETTDGVIAEYFDRYSWNWAEVECPGPGRTYSNTSHEMYNPSLPVMQNPARITFNGITNRYHAEREGLYLAYTNALRRQFITWTTELQGALVYYGAPVLFSSTLYNMLQGGEVRDYDEETGALSLSNGITSGKIVFMKPDGTLTDPMDFTKLEKEGDWIRVNGTLGFNLNWGAYNSERTKYVIVEGELIRRIVKILSISPKGLGENGAPMYEIRGVVDVPEVHTVDEFLIGRGDSDADPWEDPDDPPILPGPTPDIDFFVTLRGGSLITKQALWPNTGYPPSLLYKSDGTCYLEGYNYQFFQSYFEREWVEKSKRPITNAGSKFEIMFAAIWDQHADDPSQPPTDAFLNDTNRALITGHTLNFYEGKTGNYLERLGNMELSTQTVINSIYKRASNSIVFTNWIPMDNDVELKSWWLTKPKTNFSQARTFAVGIRDKATRTIQLDGRGRKDGIGVWQMTVQTPDYYDAP